MVEAAQIASTEVTSPDGSRSAARLAEEVFRARDAAAAVALLERLRRDGERAPSPAGVASALPKLTLLALPLLPRRQLAQAIEEELVSLIDLDADFLERQLTIALESIPRERRDTLKQALVKRLSSSSTSLTSGALARGARTVLPTVGNWVQAYLAAKEASAERFLASLPNAASFSPDDRARVAGLIRVLRLLRSSSAGIEGIEEEIPIRQTSGTIGVLEHGQVRSLPKSSPASVTLRRPTARAETPHFTPEDEQEIARHSERLSTMALTPSSTEELAETIVARLEQQHGITFSDEVLTKRFRTAMRAQLKGIRPTRETEDVLTRSPKVGGLGLPPEQARQLLVSADAEAKRLHNRQGVAGLEAERQRQQVPPAQPPRRAVPPAPRPSGAAIPSPRVSPATRPPARVSPTKRFTSRPSGVTRPRPRSADQRRIEDIRRPRARQAKTMGPVDELRALTLDEFRSYGANAASAISRLREKFDALGKEAYALRIQGVLGWRASPLYRLYLSMGNESMNTRQAVSEVVRARTTRGEPTLTVEEFHAIADLNRSLRF